MDTTKVGMRWSQGNKRAAGMDHCTQFKIRQLDKVTLGKDLKRNKETTYELSEETALRQQIA